MFLFQILKDAGLSANDVKVINVTPDAAAAAYQAGRTDIAVTYSPFLQKANAAQKNGRIIFDTSKVPSPVNAPACKSTQIKAVFFKFHSIVIKRSLLTF